MKKYLVIFLALLALASCTKEQEFQSAKFPGITGAGDEAVWVVYTHTFTDKPYVAAALALQTPPSTLGKFDTSYVQARQRETAIYSYKFHKGGEISLIWKSPQGIGSWAKQPDLKWEEQGEQMLIYRNINGTWTNIIICFKDQARLLFRFRKSYFGDTTADKERIVMEVLYTLFKLN